MLVDRLDKLFPERQVLSLGSPCLMKARHGLGGRIANELFRDARLAGEIGQLVV